jgi:hypothetical protein
MSKKFLYLYLIGGAIALGLLIYDVVTTYPHLSWNSLALDILPGILFFYLSYKTYHEKKDQELM